MLYFNSFYLRSASLGFELQFASAAISGSIDIKNYVVVRTKIKHLQHQG